MDTKNKPTKTKELTEEQKNTKEWLDDLDQEQDRISPYEKEMVADAMDAFDKFGRLTDRRYEKLRQLHDKYF